MNNKRLFSIIVVGGSLGVAASVESAMRIVAPVVGGALLHQSGASGALVMAGVFVCVCIRICSHPIGFTLKQAAAPARESTDD